VRAVEPSLLRFASETVVSVDGPDEFDSPASLRFHTGPDDVFCQHPEVGELDRFASREWLYNKIHEQERLQVGSFGVVTELFDSSRDFDQLGFEMLELLPVVLSVGSLLRRDRREVAHGLISDPDLTVLLWQSAR